MAGIAAVTDGSWRAAGVDDNEGLVQKWAERVTHAVVADARSIDALRQIGAQDFSTAVCAVGSSVEASVLITANLVDLEKFAALE